MTTIYYGQPVNIGQYANVSSTTAGVLIKTGEGALYRVTFNSATAGSVVTLYDGVSTGGTVIATITAPTGPQLATLTLRS